MASCIVLCIVEQYRCTIRQRSYKKSHGARPSLKLEGCGNPSFLVNFCPRYKLFLFVWVHNIPGIGYWRTRPWQWGMNRRSLTIMAWLLPSFKITSDQIAENPRCNLQVQLWQIYPTCQKGIRRIHTESRWVRVEQGVILSYPHPQRSNVQPTCGHAAVCPWHQHAAFS